MTSALYVFRPDRDVRGLSPIRGGGTPLKVFVLGSAPQCNVQVYSEYVSPTHARMWQDSGTGTYWVEDLGSTNGTWIIRRGKIARTRVLHGQPTQVNLGDFVQLSSHFTIPCVLR